MKYLFFLLIISSCAPSKTPQSIDDDYVLIEFASKLEEDQHRANDNSDKP